MEKTLNFHFLKNHRFKANEIRFQRSVKSQRTSDSCLAGQEAHKYQFSGKSEVRKFASKLPRVPLIDISLKYLFTHSWRSIGFSEEIFTTWVEVRKTFVQRCCIMNWACKFLRQVNFCKTLSFGHKIAITLENREGS